MRLDSFGVAVATHEKEGLNQLGKSILPRDSIGDDLVVTVLAVRFFRSEHLPQPIRSPRTAPPHPPLARRHGVAASVRHALRPTVVGISAEDDARRGVWREDDARTVCLVHLFQLGVQQRAGEVVHQRGTPAAVAGCPRPAVAPVLEQVELVHQHARLAPRVARPASREATVDRADCSDKRAAGGVDAAAAARGVEAAAWGLEAAAWGLETAA
eukprot:CAMPEP_0195642870 /NCGR_PEP_ID=MMETSP0815-20121206/27521_1 /TAXON_ID=97485 /ORGANISM="Prymnesium parvum, Strain Texoma1" /LENGTH=212 /DNA_ID=CAMNT_0040785851 /DNA_START=267 /DNA_END=904 /DNA_ORIENTATION=+